jgi:hypothetical protein
MLQTKIESIKTVLQQALKFTKLTIVKQYFYNSKFFEIFINPRNLYCLKHDERFFFNSICFPITFIINSSTLRFIFILILSILSLIYLIDSVLNINVKTTK